MCWACKEVTPAGAEGWRPMQPEHAGNSLATSPNMMISLTGLKPACTSLYGETWEVSGE